MAKAQMKTITKQDLERSRLSAIIYDVPMQTQIKDLEQAIKRQIGASLPQIEFGKPYEIDGEKRKKAYLNFKNEERVNELLKSRPLKLSRQELRISRYIPKDCHMSGHITSTLSLMVHETGKDNGSEKQITEYDLQKYFEKFGQIIACEWQNNKKKVILQFQDYDSVDQIILHDVSHSINGIKVDIEKTVTKEKTAISAYDSRLDCIHVTNMPIDVTSGELAKMFSVHAAEILLRPGDPLGSHLESDDLSMSEAWIKHRFDQKTAQTLAEKHSEKRIRGVKIQCNVVQEPVSTSELCRDYEEGSCKYPSDQCNYKHIMCNEADVCENRECWYGHSKNRKIKSDGRPMRNSHRSSYRVRISNLPSTITEAQLLQRLNIPSKYLPRVRVPDEPVSNEPMVVYLVNQPSENLLRQKIREWHDKPFSQDRPSRMQCQLEYNMDFFDWDDHYNAAGVAIQNQASSLASNRVDNICPSTTKFAPWYNGKKDTPLTTVQIEQSNDTDLKLVDVNNITKTTKKKATKVQNQGPSDMIELAPQWRWIGEKLSSDQTNTHAVYSLVDKTNNEMNAAMKVYKTELDQTARLNAQREMVVLKKLQGLDGIPRFITSNLNAHMEIESNNDPWIIMERIEGVTLGQYIRTHSTSFREKLIITFNLLNIVKQLHSRNVVHRHIDPDNIMIRTQLDRKNNHNSLSSDDMNLVLIDFRRACVTQDDELNDSMIFKDDGNYQWNTFYQSPQLERQPSIDGNNDDLKRKNIACSPSIDTSCVCAILFWLITKCYPKESRNIHREAPHQRKDHVNTISAELKRATGVWTDTEKRGPLEQHLRLIFDRGFGGVDQQWSTEALTYQLQHMLQLVMKNNEENSVFPPAVSKKQIESSLGICQPDSFFQLASLLDWMKRQFQLRYPDVHWSNGVNSQWSGHSQQAQNDDILIFQKQHRSITINMTFFAKIRKNRELMIATMAKANGTTNIELPLGVWEKHEQENVKEEILKAFELELKTLIDVLYKSKEYVVS